MIFFRYYCSTFNKRPGGSGLDHDRNATKFIHVDKYLALTQIFSAHTSIVSKGYKDRNMSMRTLLVGFGVISKDLTNNKRGENISGVKYNIWM